MILRDPTATFLTKFPICGFLKPQKTSMISVSSQRLESNTSLHPLLQWHILSLLKRVDRNQQNLAIFRQL